MTHLTKEQKKMKKELLKGWKSGNFNPALFRVWYTYRRYKTEFEPTYKTFEDFLDACIVEEVITRATPKKLNK